MTGIDWPAGFERTTADDREPNRSFEVSMSDAFDNLEAELCRQEVDDFRYEFDAQARNKDQRPYSRANPDDPSFVVRWTKDADQFAVACDAYSRLRDNVHAVGKYVNEKGRMQRRPVTTGKSEFANAQLPSGDEETIVAAEPAHAVLGVDPDASDAEVQAAYQDAVKEVHPDHGGSAEALREVRRAKEVLTDGA
jgi:DnaJ-domain-containing protein 1